MHTNFRLIATCAHITIFCSMTAGNTVCGAAPTSMCYGNTRDGCAEIAEKAYPRLTMLVRLFTDAGKYSSLLVLGVNTDDSLDSDGTVYSLEVDQCWYVIIRRLLCAALTTLQRRNNHQRCQSLLVRC